MVSVCFISTDLLTRLYQAFEALLNISYRKIDKT